MATKTCPTEMEDRTNLVGKMVILKYTHFEYINRYTHKYMSVFMYTRVCIATSMEVYIFMCMLSVVRKTVSYSRGNVFFLLNPANAVFFFQFLTDMNKMNLTKKIPHPVAPTQPGKSRFLDNSTL